MSISVVKAWNWIDQVLTDATSVTLTDAGGTYGVKRLDTGATVVAAGTAMTKISTGYYEKSFTDPAAGLSYQASVAFLNAGATYYEVKTWTAPTDLRALTTLDPYIVPRVAGAPLPLVHQAVRRILRDFCNETEVWVHQQDVLTVADQAYYAFDPPEDTVFWKLESVQIDEIDQYLECLKVDDEGITFQNAPTEADQTIEVKFSVKPDIDCANAPGWLLDRYADGIVSGAIAYLRGMAGSPWFNAQDFQLEHQRFRSAISDARIQKLQSRGPVVRVVPPELL